MYQESRFNYVTSRPFHDSICVAFDDYSGISYTRGCSRLETLVNNDTVDLVSGGCFDVDIVIHDYANMYLYKQQERQAKAQ